MRTTLLLAAAAAGMLSLAACDVEDLNFQRFQRDFHYSYPLKAGGSFSLESFNGSVDISGWDQDTVDISGTKYGPTPEAADALKIDIQNSPDEVSVRAIRPSDHRNNEGARFSVKIPRTALLERVTTSNGSIHTMDGKGPSRFRTSNGSVRVQDLEGSLDATTSNAAVELRNIAGDATVRTSNGHIEVGRLAGSLDAGTSNSSITAEAGAAGHGVRLDTSNGSVELTLPARYSGEVHVSSSNASITVRTPSEPNARIMAHTSNSEISSDYEIRAEGRFGKNSVEGAIGSGGGLLDLGTSNGSIRLMRM
ncbi:MAG TPA: DUF4097 family beta strand repeat-containing protein [Bryobacteraceae bacterium]|nr:DUF4097 family beta strand repeat-containing protein [Bryobacteraceae bacterium]